MHVWPTLPFRHPLAAALLTIAGCHSARAPTAAPLALTETTWRLATVQGQDPNRLAGEQPALLRLTTDRGVSGFGGCNRFRGTYTVLGDSLRFGPLITTRRACGGMELEQTYLEALQAVRGFRFHADSLELLDAAGHVARRLGAGAGLVAATSLDHGKPVWVVTGTDVRGLTDAAESLQAGVLRNRFALVTDRGRPLSAPER
jgi:heat shock protein HslJ